MKIKPRKLNIIEKIVVSFMVLGLVFWSAAGYAIYTYLTNK